ncbi:hypothetical protein PFISCL1PPCAC_10747, partial [Pristionchus fissidentatus]
IRELRFTNLDSQERCAVNGGIRKPVTRQRISRLLRQQDSEKAREAANARERQRMNCLNAGFDSLRKTLPKRGSARRLSKAETLREAITYIRKLHGVLVKEEVKGEGEVEKEEEKEDNERDSAPSSFPSPLLSSFPSSISSSIQSSLHWSLHSSSQSSFSMSNHHLNSPSFHFSTMSLSSPVFPQVSYEIH